jgi:hypothetical protein
MEEEARLLGYPPCCVKAHYERQAVFNQVFYKLVERAAGGDEIEMKRILEQDVQVAAETPEEEAALKEAMEFTPAPYTSFHMCKACVGDEEQRRLEALKAVPSTRPRDRQGACRADRRTHNSPAPACSLKISASRT